MKIKVNIKNPYTLGQVLQQSRLQRGFSQRELAKMIGVSQKWIWEMEQGKPGLLMDRFFKILEKTGVTLSAEFETTESETAYISGIAGVSEYE
jgi:transcriptional regulator with XRE-family HTH domain